MLQRYRALIFTLFSILFVVTLPFLVVYSLGYNLNFESQTVNNSLTVSIDTIPRGAIIEANSVRHRTPLELKIIEDRLTKLDIDSSSFLSESVILSHSKDYNSTAKLNELWLLPIDETAQYELEEGRVITFLSDSQVLIQKESGYYVQGFSFGGYQGKQSKVNLNPNLINKIASDEWSSLGKDKFWQKEQNYFLFNNLILNSWELFDFKILPFEVISVASYSNNQLLLLDKEGSLWLFDSLTKNFFFLENNIYGLNFIDSPQSIWILSRSYIYRLLPLTNSANPQDFDLQTFIYSGVQNIFDLTKDLSLDNLEHFQVKSVFLGTVFKIGTNLIYIPDSNKNSLEFVATNVRFLGTDNSTVFWITMDNNFFAYNFFQKKMQNFESLNNFLSQESIKDLELQIFYYKPWRRIFIYSNSQIASIWYDTDILNEAIIYYKPNLWIDNKTCLSKILDNYQFCFVDNQLTTYKNNSLPWQ